LVLDFPKVRIHPVWPTPSSAMVNKLVRTNKNGALLFEPDVVYRIQSN
jgi:hypothetical protein